MYGKPLPIVAHACPECGHGEAACAALRERDGQRFDNAAELRAVRKGFPKFWSDGWLEAFLCCGCARADWFVRELTVLEPDPGNGLRAERGSCARCQCDRLWRMLPIREIGTHGAEPLGLDYVKTLFGQRAVGTFSTVVCRKCGFCEWWAQGFDQLTEDAERGIERVEGVPRGPHDGPYR